MHFRNLAISILKNNRGDALITALGLVVVSLIGSAMMLQFSQDVQVNSKKPRIKSMMTSLEAKARSEIMKPTSYTGCVTGDGVGGRTSCTLDQTKITSLSRAVPGTKCPTSDTPPCGINVSVTSANMSLATGDPSNPIVSRIIVKIKYEGTEVSMKDVDVVVDVPADILQANDTNGYYQCPNNKPKFNGFKPDGTINCVALPARAAPGTFVNSISLTNLTITPEPLPSSANCAASEYVNSVNWGNGGTNFSFTCASRLDPYSVFGFTPKVAPGGNIVYTPNPDYP